jgi:putative tricarboxylic transport membrane protein
MKNRNAAELSSGIVLAVVGAFIVTQARRWQYLGPSGPGPGFFPFWYGIAIVVLSLALVVSSALRPGIPPGSVRIGRIGRALATWVALVAAVAASRLIGLTTSLALLTFFIVAVICRRPVKVAVPFALLLAAAFYVTFPLALGVPIPVGPLGF